MDSIKQLRKHADAMKKFVLSEAQKIHTKHMVKEDNGLTAEICTGCQKEPCECEKVDESPNNMDQALEQIAKDHLGVETLQTRKSDSLDFYNVSVWGIKDALKAAFELGFKSAQK